MQRDCQWRMGRGRRTRTNKACPEEPFTQPKVAIDYALIEARERGGLSGIFVAALAARDEIALGYTK